MKKRVNIFMVKYGRYVLPAVAYVLIYFAWFHYLELVNTGLKVHIIHSAIDDHIPFCEYFIIPYLAWFFYVFIVMAYLFLENKTDYLRACAFLFTGMTVFLIVSTIWPNGQNLRPAVMPRNNIFPSIHVFNSIGCNIALHRNERLKKHHIVLASSTILSTLIILATMFLKQHSFFDVISAILMSVVMYVIVYRYDFVAACKSAYRLHKNAHERTQEI